MTQLPRGLPAAIGVSACSARQATDLCSEIERKQISRRRNESARRSTSSFLDGELIAADPGSVGEAITVSLRRDAADILEGLRRGTDPREEKRRAAAEAQIASLRPLTFKDLALRFLTEGRTKRDRPLKPSTLAFYERVLQPTHSPRFGKLPPEAITRGDIRAVVERERAQGGRPPGRPRPFASLLRNPGASLLGASYPESLKPPRHPGWYGIR